VPRSIDVLFDHHDLPALTPGYGQPVKTTVLRYWASGLFLLRLPLLMRQQRHQPPVPPLLPHRLQVRR
jgi:hypothetical protein